MKSLYKVEVCCGFFKVHEVTNATTRNKVVNYRWHISETVYLVTSRTQLSPAKFIVHECLCSSHFADNYDYPSLGTIIRVSNYIKNILRK